jgi:IS1 family transposase
MFNMNRLPLSKRAQILSLLCEGMSMRAASRVADVSINSVTKLLCETGAACARYQDEALRNLTCKRVQCDEIWAFVGAKQRNVPAERKHDDDIGDVWTWTALDADTKLIVSFAVGSRDGVTAAHFISDLKDRLANRVQLTTDGHKAYLEAVETAFGADVDYGMLIKLYGESADGKSAHRRYSPAEVIGTQKVTVQGTPTKKHVSTSFVERQNLTMRMSMRRFTRLTNAFSKKIENHVHAIALHFMHYNFARIHKTLRVTPAMEAGVSKHVWTMDEIAALVPEPESKPRGPYRLKFKAAE